MRLLSLAIIVFCATLSAPALACMCANSETVEVTPNAYEQVFSGVVLSAEHTDEPVIAHPVFLGDGVVESRGHWIKSKVLVLRVWRGMPSTVAEVWTPNLTDCDLWPIPGFYFTALVQTEYGRRMAGNTYCDGAERTAATAGRGTFMFPGIAVFVAALGAVAIALFSLVKVVRRYRSSGRGLQT